MTTATPSDTTNRSLWTDRPDDWDEAVDGPPPPPPPPPAARRSRRPLAAAVAVVALAVTGAGAYAVGSAQDPATTQAPAAETAIAPTPKTDVGKVYAKVSAGVVSVRVGSGSGTGFVIDKQGTIVTNDHVVGDARPRRCASATTTRSSSRPSSAPIPRRTSRCCASIRATSARSSR